MPPTSTNTKFTNENIEEKQIDLGHHSEIGVFALQEIHEALDTIDYMINQHDEKIQEAHHQTDIDERIISEVASYDGHIETKENTTIQEIFTESAREHIPAYEIVRESISEIISETDTTTPDWDMHEHHRFTEKIITTTIPNNDVQGETATLAHSTEKKKMVLVIILLSLAIVVLGIIIIRH